MMPLIKSASAPEPLTADELGFLCNLLYEEQMRVTRGNSSWNFMKQLSDKLMNLQMTP